MQYINNISCILVFAFLTFSMTIKGASNAILFLMFITTLIYAIKFHKNNIQTKISHNLRKFLICSFLIFSSPFILTFIQFILGFPIKVNYFDSVLRFVLSAACIFLLPFINNTNNVNNVNNVNIPKNIHNEEEKTLPSWFNAAIISVLSLFLVLQIFVHFRNNIVNSFPAFRSVYSALNLSLISNTKNIEQITIEASDLNNVNIATNAANKSILKLKIMLGNRANFNQNWPLIELNLTDTLDQSVAKYTFTPQDYLDYLIYHNVAKELENNHNNNNENTNDLKAKYQQEELLYKQYKQKLKYFQAHSEQTIELYIETDNINAAGYKLAVGYL